MIVHSNTIKWWDLCGQLFVWQRKRAKNQTVNFKHTAHQYWHYHHHLSLSLSHSLSLSLSVHFNGRFPCEPGLAGLLKLRMMEVISGDNWSYESCKAPVRSSPPTNPVFYRPDALSVAQPTVSEHWRDPSSFLCAIMKKSLSYPINLVPAGPITSTRLANASPSISGGGWGSLLSRTSLQVIRVGWHSRSGGMMMRMPEWRHPRIAPPRASARKLTRNLNHHHKHHHLIHIHIHHHHHHHQPRAGSGVVRIDPLRFLAGCRTRRLYQVWFCFIS